MKTLIALLTALGLALGAAAAHGSGTGSIVVSQVFAAGGNSGAPYANDYVELLNRGSGSVDLGGWSLQYASATGTTWQATALAGTIPAGGHYLVALGSGGTSGAALPAPDATGSSNLAVAGGRVEVLSADATVQDLVGWGTAAQFEGSGPAPAPGTTTALVRAGGGCTDADDNAVDFVVAAPDPGNSASPATVCNTTGGGSGGSGGSGTVGVDVQPVLSVSLDHETLSFAGVLPGTTPAPVAEHVTVASNDSAGYTLTAQRTAFTPHDLPLGIGVGSAALAPVPVAPDPALLLASASGPSAAAGDNWVTSVGFVSPIPDVPSGHYTATLTFTVIGG